MYRVGLIVIVTLFITAAKPASTATLQYTDPPSRACNIFGEGYFLDTYVKDIDGSFSNWVEGVMGAFCQIRTQAGVLDPAGISFVKLRIQNHTKYQRTQARLCFYSYSGSWYCGAPNETPSNFVGTYDLYIYPPDGWFSSYYGAAVSVELPGRASYGATSIKAIQVYRK